MTSRKALSLCNYDTIFTFTSPHLRSMVTGLAFIHSFISFRPRPGTVFVSIRSEGGRTPTDQTWLWDRKGQIPISLSRNAGAECSQHIPPNLHLDRCLKFPSVTSAYGRDGGREGPNTDRELISSAITPWIGDQIQLAVGVG